MEDPILFWNDVAMEVNRLDHTGNMEGEHQGGPTLSSWALAIVHLAMHDAYFSVRGEANIPAPTPPAKKLYLSVPPTPPPADSDINRSASVSGAAATALTVLFSGQRPFIEAKIAELAGKNGTTDAAFSHGRKVAYAVLDTRKDDGKVMPKDDDYCASPGPLRHRKDPLNSAQPYLGVAHGKLKTFAVKTWQILNPPPPRPSPTYTNHLAEVLAKGGDPAQKTTTRTPDETTIGYYWAYDGAMKIGTPPRLYNQVARVVAKANNNQTNPTIATDQNARLFALIHCAMGDAGIHAWHYKYCYDLWRPIVGIREDDKACGPAAVPDLGITPPCNPFWKPLGAPHSNEARANFTPPFPAYPSGHATFGAAALEILRLFYKQQLNLPFADNAPDTLQFSLVSDELDGRTTDPDGSLRTRHHRKYLSLAQAMYDNSVSRIFLGVHWRFDGTTGADVAGMLQAADGIGGVPLGRSIAKDIFNSGLQQQTTPPTAPTTGCV